MHVIVHVGIQPWEDKYDEMATAMGIDPSVSILHTNMIGSIQ